MKNEDWIQFKIDLRDRYKKFALDIINTVNELPLNTVGKVIAYQLAKSGTSSYANYRASLRGRSKDEFYSKLSICVEETDETEMWLDLIREANLLNYKSIKTFHDESLELLKIVAPLRKSMS